MALTADKKPYVIYLTRTAMIWGGNSLKDFITVDFAESVFIDLEFPNVRSLNNQVLTVIEQYNLKPDKLIFVLNQELFYLKQFAASAEDEIQNFLSFVPFDEVISKRFTNPSGQQLMVVSKDLVDPLVEVFTHHGFDVLSVLPDIALGEALKTPDLFTAQIIDTIVKTSETLESFTFYSPPKVQEGMTSIRDSEGHIFNPRLIGMIAFFVMLIVVLVVVLYMNGYLGKPKKPTVTSLTPRPTVIISPTVTPENIQEASSAAEVTAESILSATLSATFQKDLNIEILNGSGVAGQADQLKSVFSNLGFSKIKTGNSSSVSQKTLILYKPTVSSNAISVITTALKELGLVSSAQENPDLGVVDVRIMTGRPEK